MTDTNQSPATTATTTKNPASPKRQTKAEAVQNQMRRAKGATIEDMTDLTGWKPHSVRAFLTGLRKKGVEIVREQRKSGASAYRILGTADEA